MRKLFLAAFTLFILHFSILHCDTVKGRIVESGGSPVSGARVTFYSRQPRFKTAGITGKDGYFKISGIPRGYYNIEIGAKGFCMEYVTRFEINEAKHGPSPKDFTVYRPGSVSGHVYGEGGAPLSGVKVNNAVTDRKGFYKIWWARPGETTINAMAQSYVKTSRRVKVEERKNTGGINFNLEAGGSISGRVLSGETGKPLKNARVNIWGESYEYASTDSGGNFIIEGMPEGTYSMGTYLQGYTQFSRENIKISKNETLVLPDINLDLRPEYFNLYDRNWTFTREEEVFLLYNSFRVKKCMVSMVKIDIEKEIGRLAGASINIKHLAKHVDISDYSAAYEKEHEIKYPHPLSDTYNKKIAIGKLPAGVYVASVKPGNLAAQKHLLVVTDMALVSKTAEDRTILYACDILTGSPLEGVKISLLDKLAVKEEGFTDKNGLYETTARYQKATAVKEGSFAYLSGSRPGMAETGRLKSYIYTDRPVYRPGQTVYFKGILREETGDAYKVADKKKASVNIRDSQGNSVYETGLDISPAGSFFGSFTLPEEPPLGNYRIHCGGDSCTFKVLEYRKPEYSVEITSGKKVYLPGEKISARVKAQYYFGEPVKNAEVRYDVYRRIASRYHYNGDEGYFNGRWGYGMQVLSGKTMTGENGEALVEIPLGKSYGDEHIYTVEAAVTDSSRREVTARSSARVVPGTFRIDIETEKYLYIPGEDIPVSISVSDYDGIPLAGKDLEMSVGFYTAGKKKSRFEEISKKSLSTDSSGRAVTIIRTGQAGHFRIYVQGSDRHNNIIAGSRRIWITGAGCPHTWTGRRQMEIILDRQGYRAGDTVRALISSSAADIPLLVSVERSKIYKQELIQMEGHGAIFEFKLEEEHIPNIYITALGVHGKKYYTASRTIDISPEESFLDIQIKSDREKYEPGDKARYEVTTRDFKGRPVPAEISFGLVDESIYGVSGELVPRIEDFFYGRKPNRVSASYSFYEWLYAGAGKDTPGVDIRRDFRDTAYWNPHILTGSDGSASLEVVLPDNLTTWRSTVRGATGETLVGTAVRKIISSKPLVARLITPRFFVEGDRLFIRGVVHNNTEEKLSLEVELSAEGLDVLDTTGKKGYAEAGGEAKIDWQVRVKDAEKAVITLKALSGKAFDAMELTVPILPYGQEIFQSGSGEVDTLSSDNFFIHPSAIPRTLKLDTYVYPSLVSGLFRNLDYLAKYPYGCVEQTLSRFIPLVYVARALKETGREDLSFLAGDAEAFENMLDNMADMANRGFSRLYAAQNGDGGWGWWSGDRSRPYTSAYVFYGLACAEKAGYPADVNRFNRARDFLRAVLKDIENPDEKTYVLFALAHSGEMEAKHAGEIYEERHALNSYSLSLLTLVYSYRGDKEKASGLLEELYERKSELTSSMSFWKTEKAGYYGWTNSDIEATAWALKATIAVDPGRKEIPSIIRYLLWREKAGFWRSTKDTAVCVLAFTDFLSISSELSPSYKITLEANATNVANIPVTRETLKKFSVVTRVPSPLLKAGEENRITLSKEGKGTAYYTHNLSYSTRDAFIESRDEGFKVEREYCRVVKEADEKGVYREKCEKMDRGTGVKAGDIIRVKISVTGKESYRYIMIEDMLPAGCEITGDTGGNWYARREDRDEKVVFFAVLFGEEKREFSYLLRAETPGKYHVLPAKASMMYLPEIWGQSAEKTLTITGK